MVKLCINFIPKSYAQRLQQSMKANVESLTHAHRDSLILLKKYATTRQGMAVMAGSIASESMVRLPDLATGLLLCRATTPTAKLALTALKVASNQVTYPISNLLTEATRGQFITRFLREEQRAATKQVHGKASVWKNEVIEASYKQQLTTGDKQLGQQTATLLGYAASLGVDVCIMVFTVQQGIVFSPVILAVAVGLETLPMLISALAAGARTRSQAKSALCERQLQAHISQAFWDNTVIGPQEATDRWQRKHETLVEQVRRAEINFSMLNGVLSFAESLPSVAESVLYQIGFGQEGMMGGTIGFLSQDTLNSYVGIKSALGGILRLKYMNMCLLDLDRTLTVRKKAKDAHQTLTPLAAKIKFERLHLTRSSAPTDAELFYRDLKTQSAPGLLTLRAPNGSGKTAFLSGCHEAMGDQSFFIPAAHALDLVLEKGSTGQNLMRLLGHIDAMEKKPQVILLDEWDANLDHDNTERAHQMIARWSKTCCVVEARNKF